MVKMVQMSKKEYVKRSRKILVFGVVIGIISSILVIGAYNWVRNDRASESGMTVLTTDDRPVVVPKGAIINGDACEITDLDDRVVSKDLETPYVAKKTMTIACDNGENSVCVIYLPDKYGINYSHEDITKKILK